jgi:nucleotide-binding universal stress UspA family protein
VGALAHAHSGGGAWMIVERDPPNMVSTQVRRVVVGVSGSISNLAALHAAALARRHGVELVAVHARRSPDGRLPHHRTPPPLGELCRNAARERLECAFTDAFGGLPPGLTVATAEAEGEAGPVLVRAAAGDGDILVVGSGWHRRLGGLLSVGRRYCATHAQCPVLLVPPPPLIRALRGTAAKTSGRQRTVSS